MIINYSSIVLNYTHCMHIFVTKHILDIRQHAFNHLIHVYIYSAIFPQKCIYTYHINAELITSKEFKTMTTQFKKNAYICIVIVVYLCLIKCDVFQFNYNDAFVVYFFYLFVYN